MTADKAHDTTGAGPLDAAQVAALVKRLLQRASTLDEAIGFAFPTSAVEREAAVALETLQSENSKLFKSLKRFNQDCDELNERAEAAEAKLATIAKPVDPKAIQALTRHQKQLDEDGVMVGVSRQALDELLAGYAALSERDAPQAQADTHDFKNFHRSLCERFDYTHDEKDWRRDQVSLIEWIAKRCEPKSYATDFLVELRTANQIRNAEYKAKTAGQDLPLLFRATELAGEVGELLNVIKKMERERLGWGGKRATFQDALEEIGGAMACFDLLCMDLDIDIAKATTREFNKVTDRLELSTYLTRSSTTEAKPVDPKLIENVAYICGQWEKNQGASSLTIAVRLLLAALDNDKEQRNG